MGRSFPSFRKHRLSLPLLICEHIFTPLLICLPLHRLSGQPQKASRPVQVSIESDGNSPICPNGKLFHLSFISTDTAVSEVSLSPQLPTLVVLMVYHACFIFVPCDHHDTLTRSIPVLRNFSCLCHLRPLGSSLSFSLWFLQTFSRFRLRVKWTLGFFPSPFPVYHCVPYISLVLNPTHGWDGSPMSYLQF